MKRLTNPFALLLSLAVLALATAGCRSGANQELLERELRYQEDHIYSLQNHLGEYKQWLEAMQTENEELRDKLAKGGTTPGASSRRSPNPAGSDLGPAHVTLPGEQAAPYSGPPQISPPNPAVPEGKLPEFIAPPNVELPSAEPIKPATPRPADGASAAQAEDGDVANITLHGELTGGYNADAQPGDEGVMVVIQPHGPSGEVIAVPAKVSVVAIDPALEGDAARIARWNFTPEQAANHALRSPVAGGLHFNLVWPQNPPAHKSLKLFVRYITPDGRKLDAEQEIEVEPPPRQARAWIRSVNPTPAQPPVQKIIPQPIERQPAAEPPASVYERPSREDRSAALPKRGPQWTPYR